jgi:hypothetical protein
MKNPQAILRHIRAERGNSVQDALFDELLERIEILPPQKLEALKDAIAKAEKRK